MIVIVEGIDRVGKTTLVNKLVDGGFIVLKDEFAVVNKVQLASFADYSVGKCESLAVLAKKLSDEGKNVVIDRLHLTELVYGTMNRAGNINEVACLAVDMLLEKAGAVLCLVKPSNLELSNSLAGCDQSKHATLFKYYYRLSSITDKMQCIYEGIDETANYILGKASKYDFYFASPFFNPAQVEREERMIKHLRSFGFSVFSPKESCHLDAKASQNSRQDVFDSNCNAIKQARAVFAVSDEKDMGTIWEAGYAYGINKPIIYFAETLGENQFNLMLAQSGRDVFTSQKEVTYGALIDAINGVQRKFRGDIE